MWCGYRPLQDKPSLGSQAASIAARVSPSPLPRDFPATPAWAEMLLRPRGPQEPRCRGQHHPPRGGEKVHFGNPGQSHCTARWFSQKRCVKTSRRLKKAAERGNFVSRHLHSSLVGSGRMLGGVRLSPGTTSFFLLTFFPPLHFAKETPQPVALGCLMKTIRLSLMSHKHQVRFAASCLRARTL